jgi:hypothetical protein
MMGMTELIITRSGMFEKKTKVDERVTRLCEYAGFGMMPGYMDGKEEDLAQYSQRKSQEGRMKMEEYKKNMPSEADIEKMGKEGKLNFAQLEMARASAKAMKESGGSGQAYAMNMLAAMDFSKLKDMPGITAEQKKQLEEAAPELAQMQMKMAQNNTAKKLGARAKLAEKYMEASANDIVLKKKMAQVKTDMKTKLDSYELPPYPVPKEWARVK